MRKRIIPFEHQSHLWYYAGTILKSLNERSEIKANLKCNRYKRLILTHHKNLNKGHYLIDDREKNGAANFEGKLIPFGSPQFKDWPAIRDYLLP
ncbi:MAG: hypothetical protein JEZ14_08190 [Marinilabiliaceae bacterium]|nr:hypothetical protein [Marinilabiliaceae bacterium]